MKTECEVKTKLEPKVHEFIKFWRIVRPVADTKIIGDSECVRFCPHNAISLRDNKLKIDYSRCDGCLICLRECKTGAIKEENE